MTYNISNASETDQTNEKQVKSVLKLAFDFSIPFKVRKKMISLNNF